MYLYVYLCICVFVFVCVCVCVCAESVCLHVSPKLFSLSAPEVLESAHSAAGYGKEVDCWAIGVISFIL